MVGFTRRYHRQIGPGGGISRQWLFGFPGLSGNNRRAVILKALNMSDLRKMWVATIKETWQNGKLEILFAGGYR